MICAGPLSTYAISADHCVKNLYCVITNGVIKSLIPLLPYSLMLSLLIFFVVVISMGASRIVTLMIFW